MDNDFFIKTIFDITKSLEPYIYHKSKSNSIYIKFQNASVGSLRIGNHKERDRYSYRWNLRHDYTEKKIVDQQKFKQYYYPVGSIYMMCQHIINFENAIRRNDEENNWSSNKI